MAAAPDWLALFAAQLPDTSVLAGLTTATLTQQLLELYKSGRTAWPCVEFPLQNFAAHIGSHCPKEGDIASGLLAMRAADLYLTGACAEGIPTALRCFDQHYLSQMPAFLSRINPPADFVDEMRQVLRTLLMIGEPGQRAKIAEYSGRGSLSSWLRVIAIRVAMRARRSQGERILADEDALPVEALPSSANPELDYLKERYQKEFRTAFHSALSKLTAMQRNLLRMHFIDGLNIERLGSLMHVHRATIARWISAAREQILDDVRLELHERLHLSDKEFDSLLNLVRSQLQVSLMRFLADTQT